MDKIVLVVQPLSADRISTCVAQRKEPLGRLLELRIAGSMKKI